MRISSDSRLLYVVLAVVLPWRATAADLDGAAIYGTHCAACHDASSATRAPAPAALKAMSPENIIQALENGIMREQGASLTAGEKQTIAEFLTGKAVGQAKPQPVTGLCAPSTASFTTSGPGWNGWGVDLGNSRFQTANAASLNAETTPRLKLK